MLRQFHSIEWYIHSDGCSEKAEKPRGAGLGDPKHPQVIIDTWPAVLAPGLTYLPFLLMGPKSRTWAKLMPGLLLRSWLLEQDCRDIVGLLLYQNVNTWFLCAGCQGYKHLWAYGLSTWLTHPMAFLMLWFLSSMRFHSHALTNLGLILISILYCIIGTNAFIYLWPNSSYLVLFS